MLCSDKTGTLTQNIMTVESKLPWCETLEQGLLLFCTTEEIAYAAKSTHFAIRDAVGTFFVSFNRVVQCTIDCAGHVLHARTMTVMCRSVFPCVFVILGCNSLHTQS